MRNTKTRIVKSVTVIQVILLIIERRCQSEVPHSSEQLHWKCELTWWLTAASSGSRPSPSVGSRSRGFQVRLGNTAIYSRRQERKEALLHGCPSHFSLQPSLHVCASMLVSVGSGRRSALKWKAEMSSGCSAFCALIICDDCM